MKPPLPDTQDDQKRWNCSQGITTGPRCDEKWKDLYGTAIPVSDQEPAGTHLSGFYDHSPSRKNHGKTSLWISLPHDRGRSRLGGSVPTERLSVTWTSVDHHLRQRTSVRLRVLAPPLRTHGDS